MGSLFKSSKPTPVPPASVGGYEEQHKKEQQRVDAIVKQNLKEIEDLSASDYTPDKATKKIINQWQATQNELISKLSSPLKPERDRKGKFTKRTVLEVLDEQ